MRHVLRIATVLIAATAADAVSAQSYRPLGGFGYGPGLGNNYMVPGYPYFGTGRPSNSSYWQRNQPGNARSNVAAQGATKPVGDGLPIEIRVPQDTNAALNFRIDGTADSLQPGASRRLVYDRRRTITFDRGGDFGTAEYALTSGLYWFEATADRGWELYHDADAGRSAATTVAPPAKNPLPPPAN